MPDFTFTVKVDGLVDSHLQQAFHDLLQSTQSSLSRIAAENAKLQGRVQELGKENQSLSAQNHKLAQELALAQEKTAKERLNAGAAPAGGHCEPEGKGALLGTGGDNQDEDGCFRLQRCITIHTAPVHSVAMGPGQSGAIVATASWDATVKLYSLSAGEVVGTLGAAEDSKMGGLYAVAFAKTNSQVLGCASCDHSVYLWDWQSGKLNTKLTGHTDEVNGIDFHTTQQVMCTASDDCKAIIWDFHEGIVLRTLDKHTKPVYGATFLGQENQYFVATCCFDQKTRVFDMRDKHVVALLQTHTDDVIGIDYSSQKQLLATGSDDGLISLWDMRTWKLQQAVNTREVAGISDNEVKGVAFSPDGGMLAAGCSSRRVLVYGVSEGRAELQTQLKGHTDCVFDVAWGACPESNASILVSASHDHTCRYWRKVA